MKHFISILAVWILSLSYVWAFDYVMRTDGTQYAWVDSCYAWGKGYFTQRTGSSAGRRQAATTAELHRWDVPDIDTPQLTIWHEGHIEIRCERQRDGAHCRESYTFTNTADEWVTLEDVGIYTPFNDNYPDSHTCLTDRCHAHVWAGGSAAYVWAEPMGANGPSLGLMVTEGSIENYDVWARGRHTSSSHMRGVFALCPPDMRLPPHGCYSLAWDLRLYPDREAFCNALRQNRGIVTTNRYVYEVGDTAVVCLEGPDCQTQRVILTEPGERRITFDYGKHLRTYADILVISNVDTLIDRRVHFILDHQQMLNADDPRYGAFMVYDCEADSIYLNDTENCNPVDRDEGAERLGMGVFLARHLLRGAWSDDRTMDLRVREALERYARFIRQRLQTPDLVTYSSVDQTNRNRAYNYPWVAEFYFLMYQITGDVQYAKDGYGTMHEMYHHFGHSFYAIGIPVQLSLQCLETAGLKREYKALLKDYRLEAEALIANGLNYPKSEVNYEQSIVAPAIQFLAQMYLVTRDDAYLDEVRHQLPVLEAFNGFQPSVHLSDIAIRHWDGHWFGKYELFGDTFPHYWSTLTASVFHLYAECTGDLRYQQRAENIVRGNLCLFSEDGSASCAFMYPQRINGTRAHFYDPYANDQDWALVYYLQILK